MSFYRMTAEAINSAMLRVFNIMFIALVWTGVVALGVASIPEVQALVITGPLKWPVILLPFVAIWFMATDQSSSKLTMYAWFGILSTSFGAMLSTIFVAYTHTSIFVALFCSSSVFVVAAGYGYFTKRDMTHWGDYLLIGLIALVIAMVVNLFVGSAAISYLLSAIAVVLFTGLTAFDAQKIRDQLYTADSSTIEQVQVYGALTLYLDFMNLFVHILNLLGLYKGPKN